MDGFVLVLTLFTAALLWKGKTSETTLIVRRQFVKGLQGLRVTVNGSSPGPVLRLQKDVTVSILVVNEIFDDATAIHWHGMTQFKTPYNDGSIGNAQCPITNVVGSNNMVYKFTPQSAGTFWYHGHYNEQYPDGLVGAIIVNDFLNEKKIYQTFGVTYDYDIDDFFFLAADYYASPASKLLHQYLSPESGGDEPMPDAFIVNGKLSDDLSVIADKSKIYRVRVVNVAAFSMFKITVDGMPLKIIEIDGQMVVPFSVSSFVVNVAQRVSFLLDFSLLNTTLSQSPAIWIRFTGMPEMYPDYDSTAPDLGLRGTVLKEPLKLQWKGVISFQNSSSLPDYPCNKPPTLTGIAAPLDNNLLQARPIDSEVAPKPTFAMDYLVEFEEDEVSGVNRAFVNGQSFRPSRANSAKGNSSLLLSYLLPDLFSQPHAIARYRYDPTRQLNYSLGDGLSPFVIPFNQSVVVVFNNTDNGEHPLHFHGRSFWILATSDFPAAETLYKPHYLKRDVVSVPANGWAKVIFISDNPGVWLLHCHIDWHVAAGMSTTVVVAPERLTTGLRDGSILPIHPSHLAACKAPHAIDYGLDGIRNHRKLVNTKPLLSIPADVSIAGEWNHVMQIRKRK